MSRTIQMKRGLLADLPTLLPGEFAFTIDTHEVFIGSDVGNVPMINSEKMAELELSYEQAAALLELTYAPELANLKSSDTSINAQIAAFNETIAAMNRGLGTTMSSMAQLLSTYPTGDGKDHIVAGSIAEVDTLTVTGIPTTAGDVTVTLNGVAKTVPVTIGRAEVASLLVTAVPSVAGNVTINLNGVAQTVAIDPAVETTTDSVAAKIRAELFAGWLNTGTGSTVIFTSTTVGVKTNATYSAGTTGASGTMTTTVEGIAAATTIIVATAIRAAVYPGWTTGGSGSIVTFTSTTVGTRTAPTFAGGTTGAAASLARTVVGEAANYHRYFWNGTAWTDGGVYQAVEVGKGSITNELIANDAVTSDKADFVIGIRQFIKPELVITGSYWTYNGAETSAALGAMSRYPKIRVKAGQPYTLNWCRPYFSFIVYDDGSYARLSSTDSPIIVKSVSVTPAKDGYLYLSTTNNTAGYPIGEWMMVNDVTAPKAYRPFGYYDTSILGFNITMEEVAPDGVDIIDTNFLTVGKNKLDASLAQDGLWVDSYGNRNSDASIFTIEQRIKPNQDFVLQGVDITAPEIWYSLYDNVGGIISGKLINFEGSVNIGINEHFITPANATKIAVSSRMKNKYLLQLEEGTAATTYEPYSLKLVGKELFNETKVEDLFPTGVRVEDTNFLEPGKNLINIALAQDGVWMDAAGVQRSESSIFMVEQGIEPSKDFVLQGTGPSQAEIWYSIFNAAGAFLTGALINYNAGVKTIGYNEHFVTPSNAATIAISARLTSKNLIQLEEGTAATSYEPYSLKLAGRNVFTGTSVEYVEYHLYADGSGDFANLRLALLDITDASPTKIYIIYVHEGDYDVSTWYTVAEIDALTAGPTLKNYVNLVGVGNKEKIRLIARLSTSTYSAASAMAFAPLNLNSICEVSNLTVIGQNTRYAIHDDMNTPGLPARHKFTDVVGIKEAGLGLSNAYGAGSGDGAHYEYDNCQFISYSGTPFRLHNTHDQTTKAVYKFNNVKAINKSSSGYGIQIESEGSLTEDELILIGVDAPAGIVVILDNYARTEMGWNPDGVNDYKSITGHGNTLSPNLISTLDGHSHYFDLNGEVVKCRAGAAISKGDAVKRTSSRTFAKMASGDDVSLFAGIALTDVLINEVAPVQVNGYYPLDRTSLSASVGNKIGIVNGALSVVTTGEYIGVVELADFIKLR